MRLLLIAIGALAVIIGVPGDSSAQFRAFVTFGTAADGDDPIRELAAGVRVDLATGWLSVGGQGDLFMSGGYPGGRSGPFARLNLIRRGSVRPFMVGGRSWGVGAGPIVGAWSAGSSTAEPEAPAVSHFQTAVTVRREADHQWNTVRSLPPGSKVEVHRFDGAKLRGRVTEANPEWITITANDRDTRIARADTTRVRVPSPGRRLIVGTLGVAAGLVGGLLVCASCANEGAPGIRNTFMAIGGAMGSLGFLIPQHRTVYKEPKRD